jgi:hypothetical protein
MAYEASGKMWPERIGHFVAKARTGQHSPFHELRPRRDLRHRLHAGASPPSPQQVERERAEERKRIEKEKQAITTRHRVLAAILQRVSAPLKKADLLAVAHYLIGHLSYSQVPSLAKRHKVEAKKDSASAQELLVKQVSTYDESELCKLLLEISLLDSAYQRSSTSRDDILFDAAKRYRVDTEKLQKSVAKEFAAKRDKKAVKPKARRSAA